MRLSRCLSLATIALLTTSSPAADPSPGIAFFQQKIRPVLVEQCYSCHSAEAQKNRKLKGGLLLDSKAALLKGGDSGPAIVPGKPDSSLLLKGLRYSDELQMPPKGKLADKVIADFETWIKMGAPDPRDGKPTTAGRTDIKKGATSGPFQPPRRPSVREF